MADPVTKKIDALPAMTDAVATNDKLMLLDVSAPATTMTKLITMNQVRISAPAQLDANVVENAKIKDGAISTSKLDQTAGSQAVATGTIRDNAVTFAKLQDVDGYSVVGRSGSTAGDANEIAAGENTVLGRVGSGNVAFNKLATTQLANTNARTVIGNATNASATPSAIASNTDGYVLRQNGDTLGFGTLTEKSLATGAVTAGKIAAGGISASSQFAAGVVDTNALRDANVTLAKMAADSVDSNQYVDGSIDTAHLNQTAGSEAVSTATIRDGAITTAKLGNLQVTSDKLATGAVTAWKIANGGINNQYQFAAGVVTNRCLDGTAGSEAVTTDKVKNGAITSDKLAAGAVTAGKIAAGGISASSQFAAQVVDTNALKNASVTNDKIANATITDDKLAAEVVNDINKNLVYIQLFQTTESIINASNRTQFFVPAYLAGKSIRQIGMGVATSETGKSITIQLGTSGTYGSISGEATKEEAITKTLPAALTKIPINVTVTSGTPAPKGLDLWFLVY